MSSFKELAKEQQEQVIDVLSTQTKRERRIGQALFAAWGLTVTLNLGCAVTLGDGFQLWPAVMNVALYAFHLIVQLLRRRSIFSEFRQGFVEPEPDHEFIKQCKKSIKRKLFRVGFVSAATSSVILGSVAFWYIKFQLFAPIVVSTLTLVGAVLVIKKANRELEEIKWQVWEFISRDEKC